jgi:hypothetical protein
MDGTAQLLAILALIYLSDCVAWNRRGSVALRALSGRRFRAALPSRAAGNPRAGLVWANPLPPLGTTFVCEPAPIAFAPEGAVVLEPLELERGPREPLRARAWTHSELAEMRCGGRTLVLDGVAIAGATTSAAAEGALDLSRELGRLDERERSARIEAELRRSLDTEAVRAAAERFEAATRTLRVACNALFLHLAVLTPAVLVLLPLATTWIWLVASLLALHVATVVVAWRARAKLPPGERADATSFLVMTALSPPQAIRAADLLARPVLARFHPLAGAALLGREDRERIARATLVDLRYPRELPDDPLLRRAAAWHRELMLACVEPALARLELDGAKLLAAPPPEDERSRAWCPRCLSQFADPGAACLDCGVPAEPYGPRAPSDQGTAQRLAANR